MNKSGSLSLPEEYHSLGPRPVRYQVVRQTEDIITVMRENGEKVDLPTDFLLRCCDHLRAAPNQTLPMQQIIKDRSQDIEYGQSIVGATLVAAGRAEVVRKKPLTLRAV